MHCRKMVLSKWESGSTWMGVVLCTFNAPFWWILAKHSAQYCSPHSKHIFGEKHWIEQKQITVLTRGSRNSIHVLNYTASSQIIAWKLKCYQYKCFGKWVNISNKCFVHVYRSRSAKMKNLYAEDTVIIKNIYLLC